MILSSVIQAALGNEKADIVLKNGKIIDVLNHDIIEGNVAIKDGIIIGIGDYEGLEEADVSGAYIAPGLIDSHIHIESAMVSPSEYARIVAPKGVTTIIADPHEIANVCGENGLRFMIEDSENIPVDIYYMLPSCVPATPFDNNGCVIDGDMTERLMKKYSFMGLGEMMNFPGVILCNSDVIKKLQTADIIDGHAPLISGRELNAYICGGISNDHECSSAQEALEKISKGLNVYIREGTGAKNLEELIKAVTPYNLRHFAFCTDDKDISDVIDEGTISHCVDKAIRLGMDPVSAYTIACFNPAVFYGLGKVGAIAPGYKADIIVTKDINATDIRQVYKNGELISANGQAFFDTPLTDKSKVIETVNIQKVAAVNLEKRFKSQEPAIHIEKGSLVTTAVYRDSAEGMCLCASIERHKATGSIGRCYIEGIEIENGAIAQTIGHDSHNITVIGSDGENMAAAVNALGKNGGIVVVKNKKVISFMELAIGGLMSDKPANIVDSEHKAVLSAITEICPEGSSELAMIVRFISLLVIPHLKLSDRGLFDVDKFDFVK